MLEKVDLTKSMEKEEYKAKMPMLEARLGELQRQCKALNIPVMIVFEGFGASGKGLQIGELIQSLRAQHYPEELLDIYVVADNCTDDTARVARQAGAAVYERHDQTRKGKGYALDYLFHRLAEEGREDYEGYFVFDADNLVDPAFTAEMNRVFDTGKYGAIT